MYKNRIDKPIVNDKEDKLNIGIYKKGLINFLNKCNTPMTVSIQGEWGSGKTSLLNLLAHELNGSNRIIKIDTWNYSLFSEDDVPMKVFMDLLNELEKYDDSLQTKFAQHKQTFWKIGKAAARITAAKLAGGGAETALDEFGDALGAKDLEKIKNDIEEAIIKIANNNSKVIFLIDDLDRLNPELAIKVLEILKNLFDCKGAIFVLAIDYEVVVKGLEKKFGEYEKNEREYRQFFDKIVQLPFSMPVEDYSLDEYLKEQLSLVEYFDNNIYLKDSKNMNYLTALCNLTIGNNPRAIKRVINYLSLIDSIIEAKEDNAKFENDKKALQFALISIQVAYPLVYKLLAKEPNYLEWDENILDTSEDIEFEKLNLSSDQVSLLDEEWEKTLYKYILGLNNKYLTSKVMYILEALNLIRKHLNEEKLKSLIYEMIQISSVTSADTNKIKFDQTDYSQIWKILKEKVDEEIIDTRKNPTSNKIKLISNISYSISIRKDSVAIFVDFERNKSKNKEIFNRLKNDENDDKRIIYIIEKSNDNEEWVDQLKNKIDEIKTKLKEEY